MEFTPLEKSADSNRRGVLNKIDKGSAYPVSDRSSLTGFSFTKRLQELPPYLF